MSESTLPPSELTVMQRDRFRLRQMRIRLERQPNRELAEKYSVELALSQTLYSARLASLPRPKLDATLPIYERSGEIKDLIAANQVVILSGETGSGKSTQLPLMALQLGIGTGGLIGHTQPRRIAARSVAERLAQQLGTPLGTDIGYKIRFSDQTNERTYVKVMTDGILLAESQGDRFLDQYEMLIVDEAHERSLNIDFILGFLKNLLTRRKDLKVIITSATIDTERFAEFFSDQAGKPAPIIHVSGRTYPVDIQYVPTNSEFEDDDLQAAIVEHCREFVSRRDGDLLVFLPTEMEIRVAAKKLRGAIDVERAEILPLYARLSPAQQSEVFRPHTKCRIVLATNVAESSITVPGIRYVIDTGTARISRYAPRTKVQRLPIEAISQASANQRAGRCGRVAPGVCVRLYSQEDFLARPAFTTPEIRRTNLAGTILQLLSLGFGDIEMFPFLDPPNPENIRDGYKTLFEIGAIDSHRRLTPDGRRLSRLPVDPRIGRMIYAAEGNGCLADMLVIASALELQDPRIRPAEKQAAADAAHQQWNDPESDFFSFLKLWDFVHQLKTNLSRNRFRAAIEKNFLSYTLTLQWQDIHRQLLSMVTDAGLRVGKRSGNYEKIHQSLLTGLLSGVAMLEDRSEYTGAGGTKFNLWPGSGLFHTKPKWIVAAEVVETSRRYGRTCAAINPDWIEPIAEHIVKRTQHDPFWSAKSQTVMAYQNTTLFGLPIRSQQRVNFTKIDPNISRRLFIEKGLVGGEIRHSFEFLLHNQMLMTDVAGLANKTRQRKLIFDSSVAEEFYARRLPVEAVDVRSLIELLKRDPALEKNLQMDWMDLGLEPEVAEAAAHMPDAVRVGNIDVPVEYEFQPGSESDGANVKLPLEALGQIDDTQLGWLIPGLLKDRVVGLIRSLPKALRRNLVPAPDVADQVIKHLKRGEGNFLEAVSSQLARIAGEPISAKDFDQGKLDPHLMVNVVVVDEGGQAVALGRSLAEIHAQLGPNHRAGKIDVDLEQWNRSGQTDWTWGDLPSEVEIVRGTTRLVAFPAIIDEHQSVSLRLVDSATKARSISERGISRLFAIKNKKVIRSQVQWLPDLEKAKVLLARWIKPDGLVEWLSDRLVTIGMIEGQAPIMTESEFVSRNSRAVELISMATQEVSLWLPKLGSAAQAVSLQLEKLSERFSDAKGDVKNQLRDLFAELTLREIPWRWLQHYPRYLQAIAARLEKLPSVAPELDRQLSKSVAEFISQFERLRKVHDQNGWFDPELTTFRWMIEEFRVSKFAQQLGTSLTVSEKRLQKQLQTVRQN